MFSTKTFLPFILVSTAMLLISGCSTAHKSDTFSGITKNCLGHKNTITIPLDSLSDNGNTPPLVFVRIDSPAKSLGGLEFTTAHTYFIMKSEMSNAQAISVMGYESYQAYFDDLKQAIMGCENYKEYTDLYASDDETPPLLQLIDAVLNESRNNPNRPFINGSISLSMWMSKRISQIAASNSMVIQTPTLSQWVCALPDLESEKENIKAYGNWGKNISVLNRISSTNSHLMLEVDKGHTDPTTNTMNMIGNVGELVLPTPHEINQLRMHTKPFADNIFLFSRFPMIMGGSYTSGAFQDAPENMNNTKEFETFWKKVTGNSFLMNRFSSYTDARIFQAPGIWTGYRFVLLDRCWVDNANQSAF